VFFRKTNTLMLCCTITGVDYENHTEPHEHKHTAWEKVEFTDVRERGTYIWHWP